MSTSTVDLSSGLVPLEEKDDDLSAGLVPLAGPTRQEASAEIGRTDVKPKEQTYGAGAHLTIAPPVRTPAGGVVSEQVEQSKGPNLVLAPRESAPGVPDFGIKPTGVNVPVGGYPNATPEALGGTPQFATDDSGKTRIKQVGPPEVRGQAVTTEEAAQRQAVGEAIANPENVGNQIVPGFGSMVAAPIALAKGNVADAAIKGLGGAGEFSSMAIAPEAMEMVASAEFGPAIKMAVALGAGQAGDHVIRKIGAERGWTPQQIELASQAVQWLPAGVYAGARLAGVRTVGGEVPKVETSGTELPEQGGVVAPEPGTKFKGVTAFPDKQGRPRAAAGVMTNPDGQRSGVVRIGDTSIGINVPKAKAVEAPIEAPAPEVLPREEPVVPASISPEPGKITPEGEQAAAQPPEIIGQPEAGAGAAPAPVVGKADTSTAEVLSDGLVPKGEDDLEAARRRPIQKPGGPIVMPHADEMRATMAVRSGDATPEEIALHENWLKRSGKNQVPLEQRASSQIAKAEQEKMGERITGHAESKAAIESGLVPKEEVKAQKPIRFSVGDKVTYQGKEHEVAGANNGANGAPNRVRLKGVKVPVPAEQVSLVPKEEHVPTEREEQPAVTEGNRSTESESRAKNVEGETQKEDSERKRKEVESTRNVNGISETTGRDTAENVRQRRIKSAMDWLEGTQSGDREAVANAAAKLARESSQSQEGEEPLVLAGDDRGRTATGTSRGNGEETRPETSALGARPSLESQRSGQSRGESGVADTLSALETARSRERNSNAAELSESSFREVVAAIRQLRDVSNHNDSVRIARSVRELLREGTPSHGQANHIAKEIGETHESLRFSQAKGVLQREPSESRPESGGRIQPGIEGEKPSGTGTTGAKGGTPDVARKDEEVKKFKHGNTQANIPDHSEAAKALDTARARISDGDLAGDGKDIGGNHVTVRYGLDGDIDKARAYLSKQAPFEASLGKTASFPPSEHSDGAAPIIAPIESPELHRINDEIQKHGQFAESSFPEYKPHATVAYVKPEKAGRYTGMDVTHGKKFTVNEIAITDRDGKQEIVKLEGEKEPKFTVKKADIVPTEEGSYEARPQTSIDGLIDAVTAKLAKGESLGNVTELNRLADEHLGEGWRTAGEFTPKDVFDAMEAGINKYLADYSKDLMKMDAIDGLEWIRRQIMDNITSQGVRTEEQITHQQFSTPPTEAYVVAKVAGITRNDVVLEPSAGNGGLAVFAKAAGAEVHVNEIAPRRQAMLKAVGFDKPTAHDGEIINSLLDPKIKPTVVIMNPPFSSKALASGPAKNRNQYGFNHVESALQRLADGGRLVAILGGGRDGFPNEGASLNNSTSREWFEKLAKLYNIRANIRISGKEYQKYGTSFATRIVVIDKDGPTENLLASQLPDADTLEQAYNSLKQVAESRPEGGRDERTKLSDTSRTGEGIEPRGSVAADTDSGVSGVRVPAGRSASADGEVPAAVRPNRVGSSAPASRPSSGPEQLPVHSEGREPRGSSESEAPEGARGSAADGDAQRQVAERGIDLEVEEANAQREEEDESSYTTYQPNLKGAKHPGSIVETKSMATVPMPPLTYKPNLPESVIGKGPDYEDAKLSAVQLEAVSIAGMQNEIILPNGARASALIGDGTGVGKGREGAAIIWDNWRKGRTRIVFMTKSKDLIEAAIRDLNALGAKDLAKNIKNLGKLNASTPIDHKGVLFTTYSLFRSGDKKGNTRAAQVDKWLRGNDDGNGGYMLMDESHNLKNAVVVQGGQASQVGVAVRAFLENMPKLRTVSLSATAATDVMNLGYLDRLGLWGPGTPFPGGFNQFAGEIANGGMSAMEMIARELKAQGKYVARTLTFKGVKYSELPVKITPEQEEIYEAAADAWENVIESMEQTIVNTTNGGGRQRAMAMSQVGSAQQRFFNLLLTSMKVPAVVEAAKKDLAEGKAVAITLINTNEAAQNREKDRVAAEDSDEEPDYDFGPRSLLVDLVQEHYPTQQYKDDVDANGNPIKVPVLDKDGHPVQNPEAVRARNELLKRLDTLAMPNNPLDDLIEQLGGPSKVAELTGRKQRFDVSKNRLVNRAGEGVSHDKVNLAEMEAYQSGKKLIAVLSSAADTGISLHADKDAKNQRQRMVYAIQVGWSADKSMQMMGRFNRTNQAIPPEYILPRTDLGGEARFISSIARRMESLEALSKGQTKTNVGTEQMSKVNFETDQGRAASTSFYNRLLTGRGEIPNMALRPDGEPYSGRDILKKMRVLKSTSGGGETVPPNDRPNITRLLNRLLALPPKIMRPLYDYFFDIFGATVQDAIDNGTLDTGVKRIPGDSFDVKEFKTLAKDPATGAHTFYYPVDAHVRTLRKSVADAEKIIAKARKDGDKPTIYRSKTGKLVLAVPARKIVHADGTTEEAVHVIRPENGVPEKAPLSRYQKVEYDYSGGRSRGVRTWEPVDKELRDTVEKLESTVESSKRDIDRYTTEVKNAEQTKTSYYDRTEYYQQQLDKAKADNKEASAQLRDAEKQLRKTDIMDLVRDEWQKTYDDAPKHMTAEHHLIGGAVMRYWNAIREASGEHLDVYSAVDQKTKQRVVGVAIPAAQINSLLARISGGKSTVNAEQIVGDVLKNGTQYDLEGGIKIRRGRVAGNNVVQFVAADPSVQKNLKDMGVLYERGLQPIYYLPTGRLSEEGSKAKTILDKVLAEYPVKQNDVKSDSGDEPKTGTGVTLRSGLDPTQFKELFPNVAEKMKEFFSDKQSSGDEQKSMMRETRGEMDRRVAQKFERLKMQHKTWSLRSRQQSLDFINAVEGGDVASLPTDQQALAKGFSDSFDEMKGELQKLKPEILQHYIENYFPHIWDRQSRARSIIRQVMAGKRPFAGKGSFLKQRTIPTTQDGIDMGLKPVSWNPVDLFMLKYKEMAQFLMAHQTLDAMKDAGTAQYVKIGEKPPEGWQQLDDRIGTVYRKAQILDEDKLDDNTFNLTFPGQSKKQAQPGVFREDIPAYHGTVLAGRYYAPADAARAFNNFVSRGFAGRSQLYDAAAWVNNNLNALQLGISAFHATTTTVNATTSDIALGIQQLTQGKFLQGVKNIAEGVTVAPSLINTIRNGSNLMKEYLEPGSYAKFAKEADAVATAGGRHKQNVMEIKPFDRMMSDFREGSIAAGLTHIPSTILDATIRPVMGWYVPRMKMGAFYEMAHNILDTAAKEGWDHEKTRSRVQKAWNSIDDRFGQLIYDNLFWHKAFRDSLMLATRSVGWNFGTIREIGGAIPDTLKETGKAFVGEKPQVTDRMAHAFALAAFSALLGGILTYLWTGKAPDTWKDYYYAKRDDGTRVSIPGYMKDVFAYADHPWRTLLNKMGPLASMTSEAIQNRDFYGTEIRHKDDNPIKQFLQVAKWAGSTALPFSVSGSKKLVEKEGEDTSTIGSTVKGMLRHPGDVALGQLGFQPAPAHIQNSPALNLAREYSASNRPPGTRTKDQADRTHAMHQIEDMYRRGQVNQEAINSYVDSGMVSQKDVGRARLIGHVDPLVLATRSLSIEQALNVFEKADDKEKSSLRPLIQHKFSNAQPADKAKVRNSYFKVMFPMRPKSEATQAQTNF